MKKEKTTISIREFGRRLNVSDTAVRKAIEKNKITKGVIYDDNGRPSIDFEIANKEWMEHGGPLQALSRGLTEINVNTPTTTAPLEVEAKTKQISLKKELESLIGDSKDKGMATTFAEATRRTAIYESKLKELKVAEAEGSLVSREKVYKVLYKFGQEIRSKFEAIPDRMIDNIVACTNRTDAHNMLAGAIAEALLALSEMKEEDLIV